MRHVVLVTAGVATLGLMVYLFVAVNSSAGVATDDEKPTGKVAERPEREKPAREEGGDNDKPRRSAAKESTPTTSDSRAPTAPTAMTQAVKPAAIDLDKDEVMASANKAYDRGNMDEAIEIAKKVLQDDPNNIRMLRVMVSASCILDDATTAQANYLLLAPGSDDRQVMKTRCERYGVKLTD